MQTRQLLESFTAAGLALSLTSDNGLKVTPAKALNDDLRDTIKAHKTALVEYLQWVTVNDCTESQEGNPSKPNLDPTTAVKVLGKVPTDAARAGVPAAIDGPSLIIAPTTDPDRWCWPHVAAWNSKEIDTFKARVSHFTDKGLSLADAESEADRLAIRDREGDDRRLCLECTHLHGMDRWRCGTWQVPGVSRQEVARDLVLMLHRCGGFMALGNISDQSAICQLISENHFLQRS